MYKQTSVLTELNKNLVIYWRMVQLKKIIGSKVLNKTWKNKKKLISGANKVKVQVNREE
jgi:hypothetical protein